MSYKRLVIIGAATFVVALIILFPARLACHWFAPDAVQLSGVSGTVWHGRAGEAQATGLYLYDLGWRLKPWRLLLGKLAARLDAKLPGGFFEGDVAVGPGGTVILRDLNAAMPLAALDKALRLGGTQGNLSLQLARADLQGGWPSQLTGTAGLSNLVVRNLSATPLGSYRAEFQSDDSGITGSVEDSDGILDLAGSIQLKPDRTYSFTGRVGATASAPASVSEQLRYLGSPDARGLREFRFEGAFQ